MQNKINAVTAKMLENDSKIGVLATLDDDGYPHLTFISSLMALGDAMAIELKLGTCEVVIAENKEGIVVFNHINEDVVLVSLTQSKSGLGTLLSWAKKPAADTASYLKAVKP